MQIQRQAIFNHLLANTDTVKGMSDKLGIQKVSARLSELRTELENSDYKLMDRWIEVSTRYGTGKTKIKQYWIKKIV
jgi:hypothetical protein